MKFTTDARSLAAALSWVSAAVPPKPALPILAGVLITAKDRDVWVSGFDYDNALQAQVEDLPRPVEVDEPGHVVVGGRALTSLMAKLKGSVTIDTQGAYLKVTAGRNTYDLPTMPSDQYPNLRDWFATDPTADVDAGALQSMVDKVTHAAAADDTVPALAGVKVTADGQHLSMACTDRYRLGISSDRFTGGTFTEALVPAKVLHATVKGLKGKVRFGTTNTLLTLADATHTASLRLIDSPFPKVDSLAKTHGTVAWKADFNATDMHEALDRLLALKNGNTVAHPIALEFNHSEMRITTHRSADNHGAEHLDCSLDAGGNEVPFVIQMNPEYLRDAINAHNIEELSIGSAKLPTAPLVVGGNDNLFYMVMPQKSTN